MLGMKALIVLITSPYHVRHLRETYLWPDLQCVLLVRVAEGGNDRSLVVLRFRQEGFPEFGLHENTAQPVRPFIDVCAKFCQCILVRVPKAAPYKAATGLTMDIIASIGALSSGP